MLIFRIGPVLWKVNDRWDGQIFKVSNLRTRLSNNYIATAPIPRCVILTSPAQGFWIFKLVAVFTLVFLSAYASHSLAAPSARTHLEENPPERVTLNVYDGEIKEIISALAIQRQLDIAMAPEVSGKISVHLHEVSLSQALKAITQAGGFHFRKSGEMYYVYKPKEGEALLDEETQIEIFRLEYAEVAKVQEILEALPGMRLVKIHEPSKTIIVEDTPANIEKVKKVLRFWDRQPKQVLIEAKILEITLTDDMRLGVDWEAVLGDGGLGTGGFSTGTLPTGGPVSPVPSSGSGIFGNLISGAGTSHQLTAALNALQGKTRIETISTPKILAIHGKRARVQVGGKQGYKVTTTNVGVATETIQFIDTGTILEITPYVDEHGNILLNVQPSINAARIEEGIPVVNSTVVSTWLMAESGETVFIGGLIQDNETDIDNGVPCLGSIPALGLLFGQRSRGIGKSELVVLITPQIIESQANRNNDAIEKTQRLEKELKDNWTQDGFLRLLE